MAALPDNEAAALRSAQQRFTFEKFDKAKESWDDYLYAFEQMCRAKGLFNGDHVEYSNSRRTLLLACVGSEPLKIVRNHFRPNDANTRTYDEVKGAFRNYYKPKVTVFSARIDFGKRNRADGESFGQYANVLRELADAAQFEAAAVDCQLRDRFAAGIRHDKVEIEIRQKWPDGREGQAIVTFEQVVRLAEGIERAENECAKGRVEDTTAIKKTTRPKHHGSGQRTKGHGPTKSICGRCGGDQHDRSQCPAIGVTCNECGKPNHYGKMCNASGAAKGTSHHGEKKKPRRKVKVKYVYESESSSDGDESVGDSSASDSDRASAAASYKAIRKIDVMTKKAVVRVKLNGKKMVMDFDTGALQSTVGVDVWKSIGSPPLRPTKALHVYGGALLPLLGEITVDVEAFGQFRVLKLVVADVRDVPLFGMDWALAFKLAKGMERLGIKHVRTQPSQNIASIAKDDDRAAFAIMNDYKPLFSGKGGLIRGYKAVIRLREGSTPKRFRARPVPFALQKRVEQELDRLVAEDALEKIDPSEVPIEWCSPTVNVEKKTGEVRICGDFKVTINPDLIIDEFPMPTFEEITAKLNGGKKFSVIDLKDAFLQLEVDEASRNYLVIATHLGFYRYKRCPFGISSAPQLFQYVISQILHGLNATASFQDDIIVTGDNDEAHIQNLRAVFDRLERAGLRTRPDKCKLMQPSVTYLGHRIDASGVHPTDEKIIAIRDQPAPKDVSQLRSFLGMVNFYSRFIPHLQGMCALLHQLLQKGAKWNWTTEYDICFQKIKDCLTRDATLAHYDESLKLTVACDASEYGLGAALLQRDSNGVERPIAFVSRTLSKSERNYAPIDREALALVFGVTRFHQYTYGKRFLLASDHKPLQHIFGPNKELPKTAANRLARWAILLSGYSYDIEYRPGKDMAMADSLSRLPLPSHERSEAEKAIASEIRHVHDRKVSDLPVDSKELRRKTAADPILGQVLTYMSSGWPERRRVSPDLYSYYEKRTELSLVHGVIVWHGRVVVPKACQRRILEMLHSGHLGAVATRGLAHHYVWWPRIDNEIEHFVKSCSSCQETRNWPPEVPLYSWNIPDRPWERVHIDFAGPIEGKMLFVLIDAYSKWTEVKVMKSATSAKVINTLLEWFSRFGTCVQIVSDNGPQFTSIEFGDFCKRQGISHIRITPYHPKSNGLAERFVQTLKNRLSATRDGTLEQRLNSVLMAYRMSPQKTTGQTPSELFLNRKLPNVLDRLKPNPKDRMGVESSKQKAAHDQSAVDRSFLPGAPVWIQNERTTGCSPGTVQRQTATHSYEIEVDGEIRRKHADQLRERAEEPPSPSPVPLSPPLAQPSLTPQQRTPEPVRRSERERRPVIRYGYEEDPQTTKWIRGRHPKKKKPTNRQD